MSHSSEAFWELARRGRIFQTEVGSGAHGINITGQDDRDEMGICIEPPEYVVGLRRFEQYIYRTQPDGVRSGPGDLDLVIYSLRKWMRLALQGNPTVLILLFAPVADDPVDDLYSSPVMREIGEHLRERADRIVSRQAGHRFRGYLESQRQQLLGLRGKKHTNRPELVEKYGFDTKFAGHMVRLGLQGVELLETGRITLPMPEPDRTWIRDLRQGRVEKQDALARAAELDAKLEKLMAGASPLPEHPDTRWVNDFLLDAHVAAWREWNVPALRPLTMMYSED